MFATVLQTMAPEMPSCQLEASLLKALRRSLEADPSFAGTRQDMVNDLQTSKAASVLASVGSLSNQHHPSVLIFCPPWQLTSTRGASLIDPKRTHIQAVDLVGMQKLCMTRRPEVILLWPFWCTRLIWQQLSLCRWCLSVILDDAQWLGPEGF